MITFKISGVKLHILFERKETFNQKQKCRLIEKKQCGGQYIEINLKMTI